MAFERTVRMIHRRGTEFLAQQSRNQKRAGMKTRVHHEAHEDHEGIIKKSPNFVPFAHFVVRASLEKFAQATKTLNDISTNSAAWQHELSSQLANNFDYCSTEIGAFLIKNSLLCALGASAVNSLLDRYHQNSDRTFPVGLSPAFAL